MTVVLPNETTTIADFMVWGSSVTDGLYWPVLTLVIAAILIVILLRKGTELTEAISAGTLFSIVFTLIGMALGIMPVIWLILEIVILVFIIIAKYT